MRLRIYQSTPTDRGRIATDVMMDQFGRIMELKPVKRFNKKTGKRMKDGPDEWTPTGECGCANH